MNKNSACAAPGRQQFARTGVYSINMTKKHFQYFSLWTAALLSISLFFISNQCVSNLKILIPLITAALLLLYFAIAGTRILQSGNTDSVDNIVRISGILGGQINLVVLIILLAGTDGFWTTESNGYLFISLLVSFVFALFNFICFYGNTSDSVNEKPGFKELLFIVIVPLLAILYCITALYQQETGISSVGKPDFILQPSQLMNEFEKDASASNQKYIGKVIRFSGSVSEISGDSSILLSLNAWKEGYSVNCDFDIALKEKLSAVLQGDSILLQCSCSGLNAPEEGMSLLSETSLEMTRCALIENFKNTPNLGTDVEHPKETPKKKPE